MGRNLTVVGEGYLLKLALEQSDKFSTVDCVSNLGQVLTVHNQDVLFVFAHTEEDCKDLIYFVKSPNCKYNKVFVQCKFKLNYSTTDEFKQLGIVNIVNGLSVKQCENIVYNELFKKKDIDNVLVFYGSAPRVGVTTISQTVATLLAKDNLNVCHIDLSHEVNYSYTKGGNDWIYDDDKFTLESLITRALNKALDDSDISNVISVTENGVSYIPGFRNLLNVRHVNVEAVESIVHVLKQLYDVVVIDAGSTSDSLVNLGALLVTNHRYLISDISKSSVNRFLAYKKNVLDTVDVSIDKLILNNTNSKVDSSIKDYISELYSCKDNVQNIPFDSLGSKAESTESLIYNLTTSKSYKSSIDSISRLTKQDLGLADTKSSGLLSTVLGKVRKS